VVFLERARAVCLFMRGQSLMTFMQLSLGWLASLQRENTAGGAEIDEMERTRDDR
jgi:hypothetical protein